MSSTSFSIPRGVPREYRLQIARSLADGTMNERTAREFISALNADAVDQTEHTAAVEPPSSTTVSPNSDKVFTPERHRAMSSPLSSPPTSSDEDSSSETPPSKRRKTEAVHPKDDSDKMDLDYDLPPTPTPCPPSRIAQVNISKGLRGVFDKVAKDLSERLASGQPAAIIIPRQHSSRLQRLRKSPNVQNKRQPLTTLALEMQGFHVTTPRTFRSVAWTRKVVVLKLQSSVLSKFPPEPRIRSTIGRLLLKPEARGVPPVWAEETFPLCESLPWFKSYEGAGYSNGEHLYAMKLSGFGGARAHIGDKSMVCRAQGGLVKIKDKSAVGGYRMGYAQDQTAGRQVLIATRQIENERPVAIILAKDCTEVPAELPHNFNVTGWFKVTDVFIEMMDGFLMYQYRLELVEPEEESWWGAKYLPETKLGAEGPPKIHECSKCGHNTPKRYMEGWMCGNQDCIKFWRLPSGERPADNLTFDTRWLNKLTPARNPPKLPLLRPTSMESYDEFNCGPATGTQPSWRGGFVCTKCNRCNARLSYFNGWSCATTGCDGRREALIEIRAKPQGIVYKETVPQWLKVHHLTIGRYMARVFEIPDTDGGKMVHFKANHASNSISHGPDEMFRELQSKDVGLQRRYMKVSKSGAGSALCCHFTMNYGMPYDYAAETDDQPFENGPEAVRRGRTLLNWAMRQAVPEAGHTDFNESLLIAYLDQSKINYHDDGEETLGPSIATLSIGDTASMKLRLKAKYYTGLNKKGDYFDKAPTRGCLKYDERLAAHNKLQKMRSELAELRNSAKASQGDPLGARQVIEDLTARVNAYVASLPVELALGLNNDGKRKTNAAIPMLELELGHGDIVIMHGQKIQNLYEHSVSSKGDRRFAITCRQILKERIVPEQMPKYEVLPDSGQFDGINFV